ncbi:VOC family protein [Actinoplanes sp. TRM 88003]|uniref:VOC family protein n=1 Tax=Paractinoplanes aksuensis TaxID=2939490 RepID=A0ABT1DYW1_9ACTN|nr:VOC family protein [Actinoplanes aksuensis]MCO8274811.1 VOC family protein [Actinoplanes aksuensis]
MPLRRRKQWWGVTLDAPDGAALGRFYARLLDWQFFSSGDGRGGAVAPSENAGYNLGFQTEENYVRPVWPAEPGQPQMSMHLEIEVDDLDEAVAHAVEAGAALAAFQPQDDVRVMLDPAGHPFCLYLGESDESEQADVA